MVSIIRTSLSHNRIMFFFLLTNQISLLGYAKLSVMQHLSYLCRSMWEYFPLRLQQVLQTGNPLVEYDNASKLPSEINKQLTEKVNRLYFENICALVCVHGELG